MARRPRRRSRRARDDVARLIGADPREIVFTSGATEANNLALKGAAHFARAHPQIGRRSRATASSPWRPSTNACSKAPPRSGARGSRSSPCRSSRTASSSLDRLADALDERTLLVSVMAAHNEIGVIQPLAEIGALCRSRGVLFHTDAAQAFGKIPLDVEAMKIDLMSISGHKIYGPKGVGALYVRRRPRVRLLPLFDGGGQERGLRSGTLPTPLCVGLGRAAALARRGNGDRGGAAARHARPAAGKPDAPGRGAAGQRRHGAPAAGQPEPVLPRPDRPRADRGVPDGRDVDRIGLHLGRRSSRPTYCARSACRMRWRTPRSGSASDASRPRTRSISRPTRWPPPLPGCMPSQGAQARGVTEAEAVPT